MVIVNELLFGATKMSEKESSVALSAGAGGPLRRRIRERMLPGSSAMGTGNTLVSGETLNSGVFGGGLGASSGMTLSSTVSAAQSSINKNRYNPFERVVDMLIYCYMEFGGIRSPQFRCVVETYLCPLFKSASRNNSIAVTSGSTGTVSPTTGLVGVSNPAPVITRLDGAHGSAGGNFNVSAASLPLQTVLLSGGETSVVGCANKVVDNLNGESVRADNGNINCNMLCPVCYGVLFEPVTVKCGHTYCKKCLQKEMGGRSCLVCSRYVSDGEVTRFKTNVLVGALVEKWWPDHMKAARLRDEGNKYFANKQVENALAAYTQALAIVPDDHLSLGNRSHCLLTAGKSEEALQDAEAAIKCCPIWAKGYFRKSSALISLGRYEEAFLSINICMYLMKMIPPRRNTSAYDDAANTQVVNEIIKILQKLFLQSSSGAVGSILKRHNVGAENNQYAPYPGARRRVGSCNSTATSFNRQHMSNSVEYNSSGDELDYVVNTHQHQYQSHSRKTNRNHQQHHDLLLRGFSTTSVVEHIIARMGRLLSKTTRDLISFEQRLRANGTQEIISLARLSNPQDVSCTDLECSLCYRLLFQPISTACGHTFCRSCLDRCMDHNPECPLCKTGLQSYLASRKHDVTNFLEVAIKTYLLKAYDERLSQHLQELNSVTHVEGKNLDVEIPIFVCTMAFPTVPCPLHVFEPRYRLMIRRCIENGSKRFGMCCYLDSESETHYGEIGTLLDIRNIQYFADGRSVVDTVGHRRFRVIQKTVVDGYNVARIELLNDVPVQDSDVPALHELHDKVYAEANEWLYSINPVRRQRIIAHFGHLPTPDENWLGSPDGPSWTWWLLAILPVEPRAQLAILSMCSLKKRLECISKVFKFIKRDMPAQGE